MRENFEVGTVGSGYVGLAPHTRSDRVARDTAVEVDGKFLRVDGERFYVRGVTYGTFAETELGLFPRREQVKEDFAAMAAAGINTVRTYTVPEPEIFDLAEEAGLKLLTGVWWDDPRYLDPTDRGSWKRMVSEARAAVKEAAETYASHPALLGFVLGNEMPGPVVTLLRLTFSSSVDRSLGRRALTQPVTNPSQSTGRSNALQKPVGHA